MGLSPKSALVKNGKKLVPNLTMSNQVGLQVVFNLREE